MYRQNVQAKIKGGLAKMGAGTLVIIGGAEDKQGECLILHKFLELAGGAKARLVIITAATECPLEVGAAYKKVFKKLGCKDIEIVDVPNRDTANSESVCEVLRAGSGFFFTGGDQLRISSALGGTVFLKTMQKKFEEGAVIAGTSAGASVMSSTMITEGDSDESPKLNTLKMSPGFGLLPGVVIDQHFAQRGRIGRLLTALGQNPSVLGLGIDEDTAVIAEGQELLVWGNQTVTVLDGSKVTHTNASLQEPDKHLALTGVITHILPHGYSFNLQTRVPSWKSLANTD
jgi:cyanophycinase